MKSQIKKLLGWVGGNLVFTMSRFLTTKRLVILYYHRVVRKEGLVQLRVKNMCVDPDEFDAQMKFLSESYNPVSENDIISALEGRGSLPNHPVWVTFDDGYKDVYTNAYPILKKYNIPATLFITTGYINKRTMPCDDYIARAAWMTPSNKIQLALDGREYNFSLYSDESRSLAMKHLWETISSNGVRKPQQLHDLIREFRVRVEDIADLFLTWAEIREMSGNGFTVGAHTVNHKILSNCSEAELMEEISRSKHEIEERLALKVFSFAYPKGRKGDYNLDNCSHVLKRCGFELAVTTIGGSNRMSLDNGRFNLRRMGTSYEDSIDFFKIKVGTGSPWQNRA